MVNICKISTTNIPKMGIDNIDFDEVYEDLKIWLKAARLENEFEESRVMLTYDIVDKCWSVGGTSLDYAVELERICGDEDFKVLPVDIEVLRTFGDLGMLGVLQIDEEIIEVTIPLDQW